MSTTSATPEAIVAAVEAVYNAQEVERIMALFHPEIVFFWNGQPAGRGLADLRRWHEERFGRPRPDYRIRKRLHAAAGDALAVEWEASWTDPATNSEWQTYGGEMWTLQEGRLREWHAYAQLYRRDRGASAWTAVL